MRYPTTSGWQVLFIVLVSSQALPAENRLTGLTPPVQLALERVEGASLRVNSGNHSFQGLIVAVGATSRPTDFRLYDDGDATVTGLVAVAHGDFMISKNTCGSQLQPTSKQRGCVISVAFRPTSAGRKTGDLTLSADNVADTVLPLDAGTPITLGTVQAQSVSTQWVSISTSTALSATVTGPFTIALQGEYQYDSIDGVTFGSSVSGSPVADALFLGVRLQTSTLGSAKGTITLSDGTTYAVTATVAGPNAIQLRPSSIQFDNVPKGSSTQPAPFTLTNNSGSALPISEVQTSAPFSASSNCGTSLAAGASCTIQVLFTPTSSSEVDGKLVVVTGSTEFTSTLQGFGWANQENIALSPAEVFLTYTHPGDVSPIQTWTVKNLSSTESVSVSVYHTSTPCTSTVTSNCAEVINQNCATLAPLASCQLTFQYVFGPPTGSRGGGNIVLIVKRSDTGSTYAFSYDIIGPANAGDNTLVAYPSPLTFPPTAIGTASDPQTVTLSNAAAYPLSIITSNMNAFNVESNCSTLAPGASCDLSVRFTPVDWGDAGATLSVSGAPPDSVWNGSVGGASIVVSGFASAATTSLASPAYPPLDFINLTPTPVPDGTHVSFSMPVRNVGSQPLIVSNVYFLPGSDTRLSVDARQCATPISPGGECVLTLTFDPEGCAVNPDQPYCGAEDYLSLETNAASSPDVYLVLAEDVHSSVSAPLNLGVMAEFGTPDFGTVPIGTSASSSVTFSGPQGPIPAVSITGTGFKLNNGCASLVGSRTATCTVQVTYAPTSVGFMAGSIKLVTDLGLTTESMWGTGIATAPTLSLSATSEAFPSTIAGAASAAKVLTLTNTGTGALGLSSFAVTGEADDFVLSNGCGSSLAANASCSISITFQPVSAGSKAAKLVITDRAASSPQTVTLTGTATSAPIVALSPSAQTFGSLVVGSTSGNQTSTVYNIGSAPLKFTSFIVKGEADDFMVSNNCGISVAPGGLCTVSMEFKPVSAGSKSATLVITDNAGSSPQSITITGTGTSPPVANLSATRETFPSTVVGSMSAAKELTLTNTGSSDAPLYFSSFSVTGEADDFVLANSCFDYLLQNSSCAISISFQPVSAGSKSATLVIRDNAVPSSQSVALAGSAAAPANK